MAGRKPDYVVKAMQQFVTGTSEVADMKGKVGAAWINSDGSISIDLNAFVVLTAHPDLHITLFPTETKDE